LNAFEAALESRAMLAQFLGPNSFVLKALTVPLIFILALGAGRFLKRRAGVKLGFLYLLFCAALSVWLPLEIFGRDFPQNAEVLRALRAASLVLGVIFILALIRRYYWELWFEKHQRTKAPTFLRQLFGLLLVVVALFVVIGGIYEKSIEGAVFGSTVVVGIIGFAMQDLLGNIIAGISLELGKPFKIGDWLVIDGQHAEVMEVNWRSTKLRTNDDIYLDIPNKTIVGGKIINLTYPSRQHAIRVMVRFDYRTPPNFVKDVMVRATMEVPGVLVAPASKVFLKDFADFTIEYEIKFWLDDESKFNDIVDGIRTNVWYAAQRHSIPIPFPIRTVQIERPGRKAEDAPTTARASVRKQPFLQLLDTPQVDKVLSSARLLRFGRGEKIIQQGEAGESMFILLAGDAEVFIRAGDHQTRVATLRSGDYCGEMSLLTGEPRSATVVARTDCELWEIAKPVMAELLQNNQPLVQKLGELLAQRRLEAEGVLASEAEKVQLMGKKDAYTDGFMRKLYSFFEL
jgi:small-conductance mechanosensitive channel